MILGRTYVMLCAIWSHLYNLKIMENTHGGVLVLVKLQASDFNFTASRTPPWVLSHFFNCKNGTKSCKSSHVIACLIMRNCLFIGCWDVTMKLFFICTLNLIMVSKMSVTLGNRWVRRNRKNRIIPEPCKV